MNFRKYLYYADSIPKLLTGMREWHLVLQFFLGLPLTERKIISLRKAGLHFQVRGKMDIWSIKETFLDRFYEKFGVLIQDGWVIIDIGAGIGEYTLFAVAGHPGSTVHAYEPFPESFSLLKANLELNGIEGVQIFPEAVGGQAGTSVLDLTSGTLVNTCHRFAGYFEMGLIWSPDSTSLAYVFEKQLMVLDMADRLEASFPLDALSLLGWLTERENDESG